MKNFLKRMQFYFFKKKVAKKMLNVKNKLKKNEDYFFDIYETFDFDKELINKLKKLDLELVFNFELEEVQEYTTRIDDEKLNKIIDNIIMIILNIKEGDGEYDEYKYENERETDAN